MTKSAGRERAIETKTHASPSFTAWMHLTEALGQVKGIYVWPEMTPKISHLFWVAYKQCQTFYKLISLNHLKIFLKF